jgi:23S rRNA (uracil1939-C5)-methyltransferase
LDPEAGIERIDIRSGSDDELLVVLESDSPETPEIEIEGEVSVAHLFGGDCVALAGQDHVVLRVLGRAFRVSGAAFFQVNTPMAEKMVEHVMGHVPDGTGTALDAYCGVGLFSAFMTGRCKRLVGVESSPAACREFAINLDEFDNVELYEDAAERALPALGLKADLVLVDPPRAGVGRQALDAIIDMGPKTLIYVSCDPATLARDARRLTEAGHGLVEARVFDLFPQTYHIESISVFER